MAIVVADLGGASLTEGEQKNYEKKFTTRASIGLVGSEEEQRRCWNILRKSQIAKTFVFWLADL